MAVVINKTDLISKQELTDCKLLLRAKLSDLEVQYNTNIVILDNNSMNYNGDFFTQLTQLVIP